MDDITIPDAAVEAAAIALYEQAVNASMSPDLWPEWGADDNRETRNAFTEGADAALAAAAEHLIAAGVERERDRVKGIASGPFTGEEGLDSFTLGWILARIDPPPGFPCSLCDGEGFTADDDDRTPWSFWANLQPPANLAVTLGLVHKVRCERCAGTGREEDTYA